MKTEAPIRAIILVLALISLIKGDELWAIAGFISFFLTFLPAIVNREFGVSIGVELEALIMIALLLHLLGGALEFYTRYSWDSLTHLVSSMLIATMGLASIYTVDRYADSIQLTPLSLAFLTVIFAIAAGVLWEIGEFASDVFFGTSEQYSYFDTIHDLIIDALGGACIAIFAPRYVRNGRIDKMLETNLNVSKIKKPNLHWMLPAIMLIFLVYFMLKRSYISLFFSFVLLALSFFPPVKKTSLAIESLFFIAILLRLLDDMLGSGYSYPGVIVLISFIFSYILDSLYGSGPWFLSFLVPINSMFISAMVEIFRFFMGFYMSNGALMMNFVYVAAISIPAGIAGWAFNDYMHGMKRRLDRE
ncbi:MAG: hypothetical protein SVE93_04895 [Candidatus Thermoplasmatota archaeon]|nr:hypothetical protein [Candidatus Thermoplasmatota archaeon]